MTVTSFVEPFGAAAPEAGRLGGKGASLSRLVALGHRVPPGFTITAGAFLRALSLMGCDPDLEALGSSIAADGPLDAEAGARILATLRDTPIPDEVLRPILAGVDQLRLWEDNREGVIVRSSATVEDSSALSFAGIFESIPITRPDDLETTIREVWSSVFSPRALAYVKDSGLTAVPTMAVVVQRFLEAERSGVMFTRFRGPGGTEQILVEHVEGGCEKLVKGEVTPDRLWMEWPATIPDDLEGLLAAPHARELARLAATLEDVFGGPQDVEWCIWRDEVHLVQSRPITAGLAPVPAGPVVGLEGVTPILTGVAASGGAGSGQVHLVFNIDQALELQRGQVLVTPMTNPDMVVAMRNSAAIVTDVGGMICHAAIVSRELGLPCVVGTETATRTLDTGQAVTVDGTGGAVYDGVLTIERAEESRRSGQWADLWEVWRESTGGHDELVPMVSSADALDDMPDGYATVVLVPDVDLRADRYGLWRDLERMALADREADLDAYVGRVAEAAARRGVSKVLLLPAGSLSADDLRAAAARSGAGRVLMHQDDLSAPRAETAVEGDWPQGPAAVPLGTAAVVRLARRSGRGFPPAVGSLEEGRNAGHDTERFFGHRPETKVTTMPDPAWRKRWWDILYEYGRFHAEHGTAAEAGEFEWLNVRPELVISPLLKSLVQPGFEMVPRVLKFGGLGPMYNKWIRGRYHFRADAFARTWAAIVDGTWDEPWMADMMWRVRMSYDRLEEVLALFPQTEEGLRDLTPTQIVALVTSWWPRWVEFFALSWFIQAQGDDVAYPFIEETVQDGMARIGDPPGDFNWPSVRDLVLPTTPVMSGDYMASVGRLRESLLDAGLATKDEALAALDRAEHPELSEQLADHLRNWHWMRDRDLVFEPWDTPGRVIETALKTEPHAVVPYEENLRRNRLALSFHFDLAGASGRSVALNHHARFLHDLNVERENHHILWLKDSYPLRRVALEVERRLVEAGSLVPGEIFFLVAPELIEAAAALPAPLPEALVERVRNRRQGFRTETRLAGPDEPQGDPEDDYL